MKIMTSDILIMMKNCRMNGGTGKRLAVCGFYLIAGLLLFSPSLYAVDWSLPMDVSGVSIVGAGVGGYPDYMGSNDYTFGAAPLMQVYFSGNRYASLIGNELRVNLLNDAHWRVGPSVIYRFGRKSVDDDVVNRVHELDDSLALGGFAGYLWHERSEPFKTLGITASFQTDVTNTGTGWTGNAQVYGTYPISRPLILTGGLGSTYASSTYMHSYFDVTPQDTMTSGLRAYSAGDGFRDNRGWVGTIINLTSDWHILTSIMYSRLMDEAGDSPIVSDRGSRDQWIYGAGLLYSW